MKKLFINSCLTGIMSLALLASSNPGYGADYINAASYAESNGISHQWFPIQKMLIMRKGLRSIKFKIGEGTAIINEKETPISSAPRLQDGQIYVPIDALQNVFTTSGGNPAATMRPVQPSVATNITKPPTAVITPQAVNNPSASTLQQTPPAINPQTVQPAPVAPRVEPPMTGEPVLLALRHSLREDHTRVVLEFSSPVTYKTDFNGENYRVTINGCRNLVPTKRTNPVGRDISKLDINSGPNKQGLILSFVLTQKTTPPTIETVGDPFRMIICLPLGTPKPPEIATPTITIDAQPTVPAATSTLAVSKPVEMEKPPELNFDIPSETLNNKSFLGRTVVIDPGHGGMDSGFIFPGRPAEKVINLETAIHLKKELEKAGFRAVLLRTGDNTLSYTQRLSLANKNGGDIFISLHTGGSKDASKIGVACYTYGQNGVFHDASAQGAKYDAIFEEWLKTTRFDLAEFLAKKIDNRLTKHLHTESRGTSQSPLLPLKFITNPAVLVEVGMLSEKTEGKNLISDNYKQAIAKSIANAVVDFFNGIEMK